MTSIMRSVVLRSCLVDRWSSSACFYTLFHIDYTFTFLWRTWYRKKSLSNGADVGCIRSWCFCCRLPTHTPTNTHTHATYTFSHTRTHKGVRACAHTHYTHQYIFIFHRLTVVSCCLKRTLPRKFEPVLYRHIKLACLLTFFVWGFGSVFNTSSHSCLIYICKFLKNRLYFVIWRRRKIFLLSVWNALLYCLCIGGGVGTGRDGIKGS